MRPSEKIKETLRKWERCRLSAYVCPAGVLTVGYGHTGPDVRRGMVITHAEAELLFDRDVEKFAAGLDRLLPDGLAQNQYDALFSFAYNVGIGAFKDSTLLRKVRKNPSDRSIPDEFGRWVRGGGKVLPGLVTRRKHEASIYLNGYDKG